MIKYGKQKEVGKEFVNEWWEKFKAGMDGLGGFFGPGAGDVVEDFFEVHVVGYFEAKLGLLLWVYFTWDGA